MREFWRRQPKWLWAIAAGAVMIEVGGALMAASRRARVEEVRDDEGEG